MCGKCPWPRDVWGHPVRLPAAVLGPVANTDVELPRRQAQPRRGREPVQHLSNILQSADAGSDQWARLLQPPGPRIRVAAQCKTEPSTERCQSSACAVAALGQTAYPSPGSHLAMLHLWPPVSRCARPAELNQVNPGLRPHSVMVLRAGFTPPVLAAPG